MAAPVGRGACYSVQRLHGHGATMTDDDPRDPYPLPQRQSVASCRQLLPLSCFSNPRILVTVGSVGTKKVASGPVSTESSFHTPLYRTLRLSSSLCLTLHCPPNAEFLLPVFIPSLTTATDAVVAAVTATILNFAITHTHRPCLFLFLCYRCRCHRHLRHSYHCFRHRVANSVSSTFPTTIASFAAASISAAATTNVSRLNG